MTLDLAVAFCSMVLGLAIGFASKLDLKGRVMFSVLKDSLVAIEIFVSRVMLMNGISSV